MHQLKKSLCLMCALCLKAIRGFYISMLLNDYEFTIHHVQIYRKRPKDFNEKNL